MSSRFTLTTLLMLTAIVVVTTNLAVILYRESRPIEWETFTHAKAETLQRDGRTVLFFGNATYHVESQLVRQQLDDTRIALAAHRGEIVPLMRTYADWDDPELHTVWKRFGHTKRPMILLFKPNGTVTKMEPLDLKAIERQIGTRSSLPTIPVLLFVGTIFACAITHYYATKRRNRGRATVAGDPPNIM